MKPLRKAVFPVAGLGTRFLPATKAMPKEMLTLVDRPLIQHAVDEARAAGIEQFIFVTSHGKGALEDYFDHNTELVQTLKERGKTEQLKILQSTEIESGNLQIVRQEQPLGLGHAVWCARHLVGDEPFAILLPDDVVLADTPCLAQMTKAYNQIGGNLVGVVDVPREQTNRYGILDIEEDKGQMVSMKGLVEKPEPEDAPSTLSVIGRYILQPKIFEFLEEKKKGAGGEIQLTDSMARLIGQQDFHGFRYEGQRFDCGHKLGFLEANIAFSLASPETGDKVKRILEKYK